MTQVTSRPAAETRERRLFEEKIEVRELQQGNGGRTLYGYAAVFNSETNIAGLWREKISAGAFREALSKPDLDVLALYAHQSDRVIGRTSSGTLRLEEDARGLKVEIDLPDTSDGRDVAVLVERGDVKGMSFGFYARRQEWDETVDPPLRTLTELDLFEVTVLARPQYTDTEVGLRSLEQARIERRSAEEAGKLPARRDISFRVARQAQIERGL